MTLDRFILLTEALCCIAIVWGFILGGFLIYKIKYPDRKNGE